MIMLVLLSSCTSGRWVVKDRQAIDRSDYEVLEQQKFLSVANSLSPDDPILRLNVKSHTTYKYTQKMLVQRSIQDYRLRPGFVALGLAGAAAAFYAANSGGGSGQSLTLNAVGALLAASGFLNLKPVGEPRPVGEERYLNPSGTVVETDTINIKEDESSPATVLVTYGERTVFEENLDQIPDGQLQIPLAQGFNDLQLTDRDPGSFDIRVSFQDSMYHYRYPVESILEPYARITTDLTELRNEPVVDPDNVLADLTRGSQIRVDTLVNDQWYRVWYGISQNYIQSKDAQLSWRSTNLSVDDRVVAVPRVPFGNIDVESNIPVLRDKTPNARALIITNENYLDPLAERQNTHRDGRLMAEYLVEALGYSAEHIHHLTDIQNPDEIYRQIDQMASEVNDSTELFMYIGGYGELQNDHELTLKNVTPVGEKSASDISLRSIFSRLAALPASKKIIAADVDFSSSIPRKLSESEQTKLLKDHASILTQRPGSVLLVGNQPGQPSYLYRSSGGEDKKHHIFPYFVARALQQQRTSISRINDLLQRNISYTARRLHDRPQQPLILGDRSLSFTAP
ncbi:caspase family protein [Fodinibius sediminis]|uniref:Caspase domain-containing protein n=1 Tax=Fodinibius sediminis TaxID=1214077 RepID=A0A521DC58_9BACT|nr:caspase family protein [Fodinibius sediminis]SMO69289.1 Caspase domain-containing protein [Fodinibius sediminis]